jgi:hypothetical protein
VLPKVKIQKPESPNVIPSVPSKPVKALPKRIERDRKTFLRRTVKQAQIISLPQYESKGILTAKLTTLNLIESGNPTHCIVRVYNGNLIVELRSSNSHMTFTTDKISDMELLELGIRQAIRKAKKAVDKPEN